MDRNTEFISRDWGRDPIRLPAVSVEVDYTRIGDRRPGLRYCARCAAALDGAPVLKGMWAYCSIECAIKIETER